MKSLRAESFAIRVVVATLSAVTVGGLVAEIALALVHTPIPDSIDRLAFAAMGGLGGILAKVTAGGRVDEEPPTEVQVVNAPDEPVPVDST